MSGILSLLLDVIVLAGLGVTIFYCIRLSTSLNNFRQYRQEFNVLLQDLSQNIDKAQNGVVTRGVLLDITAVKGKEWLEAGETVSIDDLEAAEKAQGVRLEEGDALCLRLGWYKRRNELGAPASGRPGLHAETLPWLYERGISILAADASQDAEPSGYPVIGLPIHRVGIVAMGLWLIDNCNLEELAATCQRLTRYEFQFVLSPLRMQGGTGSPANPLAIF